jgi:hypothetical protein
MGGDCRSVAMAPGTAAGGGQLLQIGKSVNPMSPVARIDFVTVHCLHAPRCSASSGRSVSELQVAAQQAA